MFIGTTGRDVAYAIPYNYLSAQMRNTNEKEAVTFVTASFLIQINYISSRTGTMTGSRLVFLLR